ncbi:MAG: 3'-5' exonuclease [Acidobacteriota bacterium]
MSTGEPQGFLERLHRHLQEKGAACGLEGLACLFLHTQDAGLGGQVLGALLARDRRFEVRDGVVRLAPRPDPFETEEVERVPFAVVDFETNGMAPERAIEIGVACFEGGEEVEAFEALLDPGTPVAPFVQRLTGIASADLAGRPTFGAVWPELAQRLRGRVLVAHNLAFDRRVLCQEIERLDRGEQLREPAFCTLRFARRLIPREEGRGLDALAERFGYEFSSRHRALDDARAAGRILYRLVDLARERVPIATWRELRDFVDGTPAEFRP